MPNKGEVLYIEKSRILDFVSCNISQYAKDLTVEQIFDFLDSCSDLRYCESHKLENEYCYSIMLIQK